MRINFFGDVCLDGIASDRFIIDPQIAGLVATAAHSVGNLESPLTYAVDGMPYRVKLMKAEPKPSSILDLFDVFTLANNHILDYKENGLTDTINFLSEQDKKFFGIGSSIKDAFIPLRLEQGNVKLAFLGFTRWRQATRKSAGTTPDHRRRLARIINDLSRDGYFVVLFPHWNYEYVDYPAPSNRQLAKRLIDAGADLIVGAHPHIVQGYERYAGKWIFHSIGNFIFNPKHLTRTEAGEQRVHQAVILKVDIAADKSYDFEIVPVHTDAGQVRLLASAERTALLDRVADLSSVFRDDRLASRRFYEQATKEIRKESTQMGSMVKDKGFMYILSRLHRVRLEDAKIKVRSMSGWQ
jgi:poly-gamma-glutamate capsule biosynthesis protein CapA/YwtB (metallophosphatase superfamily)